MDTPRVKTRHSGRAGIHPKIRGCSFGTHCVHTCAHLYTRNTPRNCTLINSSFGTRWNPYFRTPPIRDALEYTQNGGCVKTREFGTPPNTPQNTRIYNPTHSGRHVGTHCTQIHTKKYFSTKIHTNTQHSTHIHTQSASALYILGRYHTGHHIQIYIYIHIYIYSQRHRKFHRSITDSTIIIHFTTEHRTHHNIINHKKKFHRTQKNIFP